MYAEQNPIEKKNTPARSMSCVNAWEFMKKKKKKNVAVCSCTAHTNLFYHQQLPMSFLTRTISFVFILTVSRANINILALFLVRHNEKAFIQTFFQLKCVPDATVVFSVC